MSCLRRIGENMKTFINYLEEQACPIATRDIDVNLKNRQKAIDKYGYGPADPKQKNKQFWQEKAEMWKTDVKAVKQMLCGNCGAFDVSDEMRACIEKGIEGNEQGVDGMATIEKSDLGYCNFLHFKCAGDRTCNAWVVNGPIDDKDKQ
mgnify:CR=1 FL=1